MRGEPFFFSLKERMIKLVLLLLLAVNAHAGDALRLRYERVESGDRITGHGTAFGVAPRLLLTAKHNVLDKNQNPYKTLKIEVSGEWLKCEVISLHDDLDLCLLKSFADVPVFALADADAPERTKICLQGSPRGIPILNVAGSIERHYHLGGVLTRARIAFDHGNSGGPVLADGRVVGMAVSGVPKNGDLDKELCLFLPVSALKSFVLSAK